MLSIMYFGKCSLKAHKEKQLLVPWVVEGVEEQVFVVADVACEGDKHLEL